jgi:hypothetical protein
LKEKDDAMTFVKLFNSRQRARILTGLMVCGVFLVYRATLHPGFFPGESARQVAVALRKDSSVLHVRKGQGEITDSSSLDKVTRQDREFTFLTRYRVWILVSSLAARMPLGTLPLRMNVLSAVFGALSVGLLFASVRTLLLLFTFHVSPVASRRRKIAGSVAGLAAATALGASAPFWLAATRCLPNTFEIFLLVLMGGLLIKAVVHHREWPISVFGILLGLSIFESDAGVWMAPLMLFFAVRAIRMGDLGAVNGIVALVSGVTLGGALYLTINWLGLHGGASSSFLLPFREFSQSIRILWSIVFGGWLVDSLLLIILCFVILPALATTALVIWGDRDATGPSGGLLLLTLLGTVTIALTSSSISPWGAYRLMDGQILPCTLYLLNALIVGYLVGQGCLMTGGRFFPDVTHGKRWGSRVNAEELGDKNSPLGRLLMGYVCVLLIASGLFNLREVLDWQEPLSGRVAAEVVRRLEGRRWVVSDGALDVLIRLQAQMAGTFVGLLNNETQGRVMGEPARRMILKDPAFAGVDGARLTEALRETNSATFAQALLICDPQVEKNVMVWTPAALWEPARRAVVPDVVGYLGVVDGTTVDWDAQIRAHVEFWDEVDRFPALGSLAPAWLRGHRAKIRQQLYDVGVRLADECALAGRREEAKSVLERATRIKEEPPPSNLEAFY